MSNKIFLVTAPDDIIQDASRVLFVNLDDTQTQFVSACLNKLHRLPTTVIYMWHSGDDFQWLLDKKNKSTLILFNADTEDELITGYLAAQPKSYYLGQLRGINAANPNLILDEDHLINILTDHL